MKESAPGSGDLNSWAAMAERAFVFISCLLTPANTHSVRLTYCGSTVRTAGGLKQFGARSFGFQNCGSSKPASQERSTKQTKPFLPLTAVSYPRSPSTSTSASAEIEGGAAVRASAISSSRAEIRYCPIGAIAGYAAAFLSCACTVNANKNDNVQGRKPDLFIF